MEDSGLGADTEGHEGIEGIEGIEGTTPTEDSGLRTTDGAGTISQPPPRAGDVPLTAECIFGSCEGTARLQLTSWDCSLCKKTWPHQFKFTPAQFLQLTQERKDS